MSEVQLFVFRRLASRVKEVIRYVEKNCVVLTGIDCRVFSPLLSACSDGREGEGDGV